MSLSTIRTTVSLLTLNALLQIYETQPVEFWDSNHMMSHPKLTPIFQSNQHINLLSGLVTMIIADRKNKFNLLSSLMIGASVIIQNLNLYLPKTFNMVQIYFQLIVLIYQVFLILSMYYERITLQMPTISQDILKESKQVRKPAKRNIQHKKKEKQQVIQTVVEQPQQIQLVEEPQQQDINEVESIENDFTEFMKQPSTDQTVTEIETENLYEINHADLSQISSAKEVEKLQFQIKFNGNYQTLNCTFDTFDTTMSILNTTHTPDQIKQIKIHLLLNLYDENEDCTCRLWCLKKLLSLN